MPSLLYFRKLAFWDTQYRKPAACSRTLNKLLSAIKCYFLHNCRTRSLELVSYHIRTIANFAFEDTGRPEDVKYEAHLEKKTTNV